MKKYLENGKQYGNIVILERTNKKHNKYYLYKCKCLKCGKIFERTSNSIVCSAKRTKNVTCGCYFKHNNLYKHGLSKTRIHTIWNQMRQRCYDNKCKAYKYYGNREITVCDEWLNKENGFMNFYNWAMKNGYRDDLTIDRIDNNGNYEPNNCRWTTKLEQSRNRRNIIKITYNNETKPIFEWAKEYNIKLCTLRTRINRGWDIERALKEPTH